MEIISSLPDWNGKKILCVRLDRIGDLLITTPFLRALKRAFPDAQIDAFASSLNVPVLKYNKDISNRYVYNKKKPFAFLLTFLKMRREKYDVIICITSRSHTSNFIVKYIPSPVKVAFGGTLQGQEDIYTHMLVDKAENKHVMLHYKALAESMGLEVPAVQPYLDVPEKVQKQEDEKHPKDASIFRLVLFIGNIKKQFNRWPTEKFIKLIHKIHSDGLGDRIEIFVMAGKSDMPLLEDFRDVPKDLYELYIGADIYESAAFLKNADLYIGTSSGPTHIASSVACPILSLTTGYVSTMWLPLGEKDSNIEAALYDASGERGVVDVPVDVVYSRVLEYYQNFKKNIE